MSADSKTAHSETAHSEAAQSEVARRGGLVRRFWIYQAERFPIAAYTVLVAAMVFGTSGYALAARGASAWMPQALFVAWFVALGIFFQLRVADEFKDYALDLRFRPYRPVPRGLISRRELAWLALGVGLAQVGLTWWLDARLLFFLVAVWLYLLLMAREFFVHDWLLAHPLVYMLSHMVIMVLLFAYIFATAWLPQDLMPPLGLGWFLLAGYANGVVFEIGRKVRAPEDEETGVETYSQLWGPRLAVAAWWIALVVAGLGLALALYAAGKGLFFTGFAGALLGLGAWIAVRYAAQPLPDRAKRVDSFSALWVLALYAVMGTAPYW